MFKRCLVSVLVTILLLSTITMPVLAQGDSVVHAVFFYSPTCGHCHLIMEEVLPVLQKEYGSSLIIAQFDTTTPQGNALWQAAVTILKPTVAGVPTLVIGDNIMVGSREIPDNFPVFIDQYLQLGGVGWPALPGIEQAVEDMEFAEPQPATLAELFTRDLAGNIVSVFVLVGLVITFFTIIEHRSWQASFAKRFEPWGIFIAFVVGLTAASYLTYVETTQTPAICGPIGDCNTVQQSEFALLFGFLPVAVLGFIGYISILILYIYGKYVRGPWYVYAPGVEFLMILFGLAFSTYLTFLEPFVIGATCAWCLTSAICMLVLALARADAGWKGLKKIAGDLQHAQQKQ